LGRTFSLEYDEICTIPIEKLLATPSEYLSEQEKKAQAGEEKERRSNRNPDEEEEEVDEEEEKQKKEAEQKKINVKAEKTALSVYYNEISLRAAGTLSLLRSPSPPPFISPLPPCCSPPSFYPQFEFCLGELQRREAIDVAKKMGLKKGIIKLLENTTIRAYVSPSPFFSLFSLLSSLSLLSLPFISLIFPFLSFVMFEY
jgi:hypothetical protein